MKRFLLHIFFAIPFFGGCQTTKDELILQKNACYNKQLILFKGLDFYKIMHTSFSDTFAIIKGARARPSLLNEKIDDAIFFNKDSSECLLIVLERDDDKAGVFGSATIFQGKLLMEKWRFEQSMSFTFSNEYYKKYEENTFDNISELARYSVLTEGKARINGCEIDDYFWFKYLKD